MYQANPIPRKGKYLLAEPFLQDPNFRRSVILITEHNENGTVGFILNRKLNLDVSELIPELAEKGFNAPVFLGGPVSPNSLHFIHRSSALKSWSEELGKGIYWGTDFEKLFDAIGNRTVGPDDLRFFLGYSGWAPQQLEEEIKIQSWILSPGKEQFTFSVDVQNLWRAILSEMGNKFREISIYPEDPSLN